MDARGVDARPITAGALVESGEPIVEAAGIGLSVQDVDILRPHKEPVILDRIGKCWHRGIPNKQIR